MIQIPKISLGSPLISSLSANLSSLLSSIHLSWTVKVKVKVLVAQLYLTLCNHIDCSLLGSSVHGILQTRILECAAISFSRGSS